MAQALMAKTDALAAPSTGKKASRQSRATVARQTKWLVISSGKGGSGKSTLARNLAVFASHSGFKTATLDLDGQQSLTSWMAVRPEGVPEFINVTTPLDNLREAIEALNERPELDLIIVDTPPGVDANPVEMRRLIQKADYVLIPTGQGASDLRSVTEWIRFIQREERRCAFVMNLTKRRSGSYDRAKLALVRSGKVCPFDIRDLESVRVSDELGLGVLEMRDANGVVDFEGLWQFVKAEMGLKTND